MKKYILSVGLNDKDTKVQKVATLEAYKVIENAALKVGIEGFTIYEAKGFYTHENGKRVIEKTLRIEIYDFADNQFDNIRELVGVVKAVLNQESVAVEVLEVNSSLM